MLRLEFLPKERDRSVQFSLIVRGHDNTQKTSQRDKFRFGLPQLYKRDRPPRRRITIRKPLYDGVEQEHKLMPLRKTCFILEMLTGSSETLTNGVWTQLK